MPVSLSSSRLRGVGAAAVLVAAVAVPALIPASGAPAAAPAAALGAPAVGAPAVEAAAVGDPALGDRGPAVGSGAPHWVDSWVSMPQLTEPANLPPAPFTGPDSVLVDATIRQTVHTTLGGGIVRLRFSNAFGATPLPLTSVTVARPVDGRAGVSAVRPGTVRPVTFAGRRATTVPPGAQVVSDPVRFDVAARTNLTVTAHLATGQAGTSITSHPGSRTTSHLLAGDHVAAADLPGATPVDHWYFLSGVEVLAAPRAAGLVVLGDSLTDGRGSTTNGNDRWPDQLLDRLRARPDTARVAVLNEAAGGNRVLADGLGPSALARLDRDVLVRSGARWLLVFEGVNDLGTAEPTAAAQQQVTTDLLAAYEQIAVRAHAEGLRVYGATLTPFGGNTGYDDPAGLREASRQAVNRWIRGTRVFDAVVDFDAAVRDPADPRRLRPAADVGDHLHLNPTGSGLLAAAVPAALLR